MNPRKTPSFFLAALAAITLTAALPMGVMAESTNTVTVTKFHQSYPYSGKATVEFTVSGTLPADAVAEITLSTDNASAIITKKNILAGANTLTINFASSFGGALVLSNASFVVTITRDIGGVKLWEGGPYWAECNLGASKPEEYGYYFWWGDTVGYTPIGGTWTDDDWSVVPGVTWVSSTGEQMSSSPFSSSSCPTRNKDDATLQSEGYIDSTGNLVAAHDAARVHLLSPWRLPTDAEFSALVSNCTATWITTNGVHGQLVTGKGAYANRSIFLPAAGFGYDSSLYYPGSEGNYRSSTPLSGYPNDAWHLNFDSISFRKSSAYRHYGQSVRPVQQGFAGCSAFGIVTYDSSYEIWSAANGVEGAWDETDALGIHNVFRYAFDKPSGAFADPPLLDIAIEDGNAVVKTPQVVNAASFAVSVVESSDIAGVTMTARKPIDAMGRAVFAMESAPSRFYRLAATPAKTGGVQLWANGPYWATTNIGAERPEEAGWYFWWGDTVGYRRERDAWVATDGSSSNFQFSDDPISQQTSNKSIDTLKREGWIVARNGIYVLAPEHDAAYVKWGGNWRMPTKQEQSFLNSKCDWAWATTNGVNGYVVRGRDDYASNSIFLPAAGNGNGTSLGSFGSHGRYWSSALYAFGTGNSWALHFMSDSHDADDYYGRGRGYSVRPVRDAD
jgi:hypothetical protein